VTGLLVTLRAELRDLVVHPLLWAATAAVVLSTWYFGAHAAYDDNGWVVISSALGAGTRAAGFFLLAIAALTISRERTRGTVRWILPRPVGRVGFVLGKAAAVALVALALLALTVLVAWLVARGKGFGDVVLAGDDLGGFDFGEPAPVDPAFAAEAMAPRLQAACLRLAPALLSIAGLGMLCSALFRSSAGAVIASVAALLPLVAMPGALGLSTESARFSPFHAADEALAQLGLFGRNISDAAWPPFSAACWTGALVGAVGLPLLAALLFTRLDLTD